jgi:hypothetical protein
MKEGDRKRNFTEYLTFHYPYYACMVRIGRLAVHFGQPPKETNIDSIKNLDVGPYSVNVAIGSGEIGLIRRDLSQLDETPSFGDSDVGFKIYPNGRIEAKINPENEPIARSFKRPMGKDVYFEINPSGILEIRSLANKLCLETQRYFTELTEDALKTFKGACLFQEFQKSLKKQISSKFHLN